MHSATVEDYVKQLYLRQQAAAGAGRGQGAGRLVPVGALARAVGVVPGTATTMAKALADAGLIHYAPRSGVRLTRDGEQLALHVLRRHRLVELLLVRVLGLDWADVHLEAERLEHAVSDRVLAAIDRLLGHPEVDPHGDPIPSARGTVAEASRTSLATCPLLRPVRVSRVADQSPGFLRVLDRHGLVPGRVVRVQARDPDAASVVISAGNPGDAPVTLGLSAAEKVFVESPVPSAPAQQPTGHRGDEDHPRRIHPHRQRRH